jgi:hypothetical protein
MLPSGLILATIALASGAAFADEPKHKEPKGGEASDYPVSYVERPLTLPRFALAPELELDVTRTTIVITVGGPTTIEMGAGMALAATFGITSDFEVGAVVAPIEFAPTAAYGDPQIFATYRFLHQKDFDLGARLRTTLITPHEGEAAGVVITPSVPFLLHIGKIARFDAEVGVPIVIYGSTTLGPGFTMASHVAVGLDVPLALAFDIIEPLHVGVSTGVGIGDLGHPKETTVIPLGIFLGYAIGHGRPILDIDPFFTFVDFITPGGELGSGDRINPGIFVGGVSLRGYIYL